MKLIDLISYGLVLCHKLCIILMSMCFIEINIYKILPVLLVCPLWDLKSTKRTLNNSPFLKNNGEF